MQSKTKINILLFIFAFSAVFALFRFTNFSESGLGQYFNEKITNLSRIINDKTPEAALSNLEKENLQESLSGAVKPPEFFCKSTYFPLLSGAKWNYEVTSGDDKDSITFGIPAPENGINFFDSILQSKKDWTVRSLFVCKDNKIEMTDLNFLMTASKSGLLGEPCTKGAYDFFLPTDQMLDSTYSFEENGCLNYKKIGEENQDSTIKENIFSKWKIAGNEEVSVPAGKFTTKKIEINFTLRQEFSGGAKTTESKTTLWVAQGVGIVKILSETQEAGTNPVKTTITKEELSSFQIPTEGDSKIKN